MPTNLTGEERQRLKRVISQLPEFRGQRGRLEFLRGVLEGYADGPALIGQLLAHLDLEGPPDLVAGEVLNWFPGYGVARGVDALDLLLNHLATRVYGPDQQAIEAMMARRQLAGELPLLENPAPWPDPIPAERVREERIIGENTLRHINVLAKALEAARAVVRIALVGGGAGSGFMVSPTLLLTNHHVIADQPQADGAELWFDYELDGAGHPRSPTIARPTNEGLLLTDPTLDFSLIRVAEPPDFGAPLRFARHQAEKGRRVAIIQHPGGGHKQISLQNNFVAHADARLLQYYTSTEAGSSGSPVFDDDFRVVGLHRGWIRLDAPDTGHGAPRYFRNQGSSAPALLAAIRDARPDLADELTLS